MSISLKPTWRGILKVAELMTLDMKKIDICKHDDAIVIDDEINFPNTSVKIKTK